MPSLYQLVTKPKDCAFVVGLPVTREGFYRSQEMEQSYYTKRFWHWPEYCREFLDDYRVLRAELVRLGVHLIEYASIHDFRDVWNHGYHAVVLFSHWEKDGIEFREGIISSESIERAIPIEILGTLDLSVCHPQKLVNTLSATQPELLTKSIWEKANPKYWCMFYKALFLLLQNKEMSYPEGIHEITDAFMTRSARRKGAEK